jgi:flagellar protein FliO/FliZ
MGACLSFLDFLRAVLALAATLGLIGVAAVVARKYAPDLLARMQAKSGKRRLEVVETLVLDPSRRLVLVRVDDKERMLLLGDGRELDAPQAPGGGRPR